MQIVVGNRHAAMSSQVTGQRSTAIGMMVYIREESVPETVWLDKVDIGAVQAVSKVLRELTDVIRDIRELPTQAEKHAQRLAEEKLELMREQSEQSSGGFGIQLSQEVEELAE
jgi:predicted ATP-grasp superfamily ATP-dependent carboligase